MKPTGMEIVGVGGVKLRKTHHGRYGYFLEPHIISQLPVFTKMSLEC